jgi:hypothetical protein
VILLCSHQRLDLLLFLATADEVSEILRLPSVEGISSNDFKDASTLAMIGEPIELDAEPSGRSGLPLDLAMD